MPIAKAALLLALLTSFALCVSAAEKVLAVPETPFFEKPDAKSKVVGVCKADTEIESSESVEGLFQYPHLADREWLPIGLATRFHKAAGANGEPVWFSEDIKLDAVKGPLPISLPQPSRFGAVAATYGLFLLGLLLTLKLGFRNLFSPGWKSAAMALWLLISLRLCLSATAIYMAGAVVIIPTDEVSYFKIGKDIIASGHPTFTWMYTVGNCLWHIPFILAMKAESFMDIRTAISFFNSFATASGIIALTWLAIEKLSGSRTKAFAASALLAMLPFISFPVELFATRVFKNVMAIPEINPCSYRLYDIFNHIGYNGLSDTPSTFLCLLSLAMTLCIKPKSTWQFAAVAATYSFACLVRVNNAMLAPLIAYLLWRKLSEDGASLKAMLWNAAACACAFLLVFSPQFMANAVQFGSPLTFPYVLHACNAGKGFMLSCVPFGLDYLLGCNFIVACLAAAALPFAPSAKSRISLALLGIPMLLFFCGYPVVGASPTRFTLTCYPAFLGAFAIARFWDSLDAKGRIVLGGALLAACALCSPCHRMTPPFPWDIDNYAWGASLALTLNIAVPLLCLGVAGWLYGKSRAAGLFLLLFSALYFAGSALLLFAFICALLCWALASFAKEVLDFFKRPEAQSSSSSTGQ